MAWGISGAQQVPAALTVVIDVLSFTTSVDIAVSKEARVYPWPGEQSADDFTTAMEATLAVGRSRGTSGSPTLSPASIRDADLQRSLVLPSPNGSRIQI